MNAMIMRDEKVMDESFEGMVLLLLKDKFDLDLKKGMKDVLEFDDASARYRAVEEESLEMAPGAEDGRYDYKLSIYDEEGYLGLAVKLALSLSEGAPRAPNRWSRRG